MRLKAVASVIPIALATCGGTPSGSDLTIDVFLAQENNKCVVRFTDTGQKDARHAVAWTDHAVIWRVVRNDCGEKTKIDKKALGLKYLKVKKTGAPAAWFDQCTKLDKVPAKDPVDFKCQIPSSKTGDWEGVYEYEIDGDSVEPVDPDIGVKRNG
jgi:hypothetical protein